MLPTALPPAVGVLAVAGFAALMFLMVLVNNLFARKMSGWSDIARRFPMTNIHDVSNIYKRKSGYFGNMSCSRGLTIRVAHEGVCLLPSFARRIPCLIPWSNIRNVSVSGTSLLLTVEYERPFQFSLPTEALPTLRAKLSPESFGKAVSPFDVSTGT